MAHSNHGIVKNNKGEEQPADKVRAQAGHESHSSRSVSREGTRDPKLSNSSKAPESGLPPEGNNAGPTDQS